MVAGCASAGTRGWRVARRGADVRRRGSLLRERVVGVILPETLDLPVVGELVVHLVVGVDTALQQDIDFRERDVVESAGTVR